MKTRSILTVLVLAIILSAIPFTLPVKVVTGMSGDLKSGDPVQMYDLPDAHRTEIPCRSPKYLPRITESSGDRGVRYADGCPLARITILEPTVKPKPKPADPVVEPVVQPTPEPAPQPTPSPAPSPEPDDDDDDDDKQHCNKGEGNGGEGCDPGRNPDKGNNDED